MVGRSFSLAVAAAAATTITSVALAPPVAGSQQQNAVVSEVPSTTTPHAIDGDGVANRWDRFPNDPRRY